MSKLESYEHIYKNAAIGASIIYHKNYTDMEKKVPSSEGIITHMERCYSCHEEADIFGCRYKMEINNDPTFTCFRYGNNCTIISITSNFIKIDEFSC